VLTKRNRYSNSCAASGTGIDEAAIDEVRQSATGREAVRIGLRTVLQSQQPQRAYQIGSIIGSTFRSHRSWEEATEFIQDLERLNRVDIDAIKLLWRHQREVFRTPASVDGQREISFKGDELRDSWGKVVAASRARGISADDWDARCARLGGFGLASPFQFTLAGSGHRSPFRLTGRAGRFLTLLGRNTEPGAYRAMRYHPTEPERRVEDEDDDAALGGAPCATHPTPRTLRVES
jgi:hypothetical protein